MLGTLIGTEEDAIQALGLSNLSIPRDSVPPMDFGVLDRDGEGAFQNSLQSFFSHPSASALNTSAKCMVPACLLPTRGMQDGSDKPDEAVYFFTGKPDATHCLSPIYGEWKSKAKAKDGEVVVENTSRVKAIDHDVLAQAIERVCARAWLSHTMHSFGVLPPRPQPGAIPHFSE